MGIFNGVFSQAVSKHMLSDGGTGYAVQMGGCGMSEKMRMEVFVDTAAISRTAEDIL